MKTILLPLPADFPIPILVVRHQSNKQDDYIITALNKVTQLQVKFAEANEQPLPGRIYIAPPDRHLLVDAAGKLQLSAGKVVNYSRPAIDVLFKSAAKKFTDSLLAVVLTGANSDGINGVIEIKKRGGQLLVQDPDSAEAATMPKAALAVAEADYVIWLDQIGPQIWTLTR